MLNRPEHISSYVRIALTIFILCLFSGSAFSAGELSEKSLSVQQVEYPVPDFGADGLKGLTEEQRRRLDSGEVVMTSSPEVTPKGKTMISAALIIKASIDRVWQILSATEKQTEYIEEIEKLKLLEQGPDFNRMEFVVKVMGKRVRYTVIHRFTPEKYYFWWELDKKAHHDLKELSGFWRLYPAGENRTVARYGSRVVPGFLVPEFIRNWLYKKSVRSSLQKVRSYVEEKGWEPLV
jgi:hypothetical protein